jgi:hypothetical protein
LTNNTYPEAYKVNHSIFSNNNFAVSGTFASLTSDALGTTSPFIPSKAGGSAVRSPRTTWHHNFAQEGRSLSENVRMNVSKSLAAEINPKPLNNPGPANIKTGRAATWAAW